MSDYEQSNVGMGMVPCKKNCRCSDCQIERLTAVAKALAKRVGALELSEELAWGIIANAYGGDWNLANEDWQTAAVRWRDNYVETPGSERPEVIPRNTNQNAE